MGYEKHNKVVGFVQQAKDMAAYNRWMNQRLYRICAELSNDERHEDRGAFFKSIHGTLNHLLLGDRLWMSRFLDESFKIESLSQELYANFDDLSEERDRTDEIILKWAGTLTEEKLTSTLIYTSSANPAPQKYEMWIAVTHFFNHQTHHRGQLTTLLNQYGKDSGITDLISLPEVQERNEIL